MIIYLKALNKKECKLDKVPLIPFNILTSCANRRPQQSMPSAIKLFSFTIEINFMIIMVVKTGYKKQIYFYKLLTTSISGYLSDICFEACVVSILLPIKPWTNTTKCLFSIFIRVEEGTKKRKKNDYYDFVINFFRMVQTQTYSLVLILYLSIYTE